MMNAAPANTIRRRRHRSMFTVSANGVVLGKGLLDLVELALVILGERHDPFSSAPGGRFQLRNGASRVAQAGRC